MKGDSQSENALREQLAKACAERKLLLSYHGDITPRGMQRTWPNIVTQEGVKGEEYYLQMISSCKSPEPSPLYNVNLAFTRNIPGSMDYTPISLEPSQRTTTTAHEMALPVVFESGWQCINLSPEAAKKHPQVMAFLKHVPAAWDDTRLVTGHPDEFVVIAQKVEGRPGAEMVSQRILDAIHAPLRLHDRQVFIGTSIGIALFPDDSDNAERLLQLADDALYLVKKSGKDGSSFSEATA